MEIIREYKPQDKAMVERCMFEVQEEEMARQPEYWQSPEQTIRDGQTDYLLKWIGNSDGKLFVAETDGDVVGYIMAVIDDGKNSSPAIKLRRLGYIPDFVVRRDYRRKGIGKKLLDAAESYLKDRNCEYVSLDVSTDNPALDFYKKIGYREKNINLKKKLQ